MTLIKKSLASLLALLFLSLNSIVYAENESNLGSLETIQELPPPPVHQPSTSSSTAEDDMLSMTAALLLTFALLTLASAPAYELAEDPELATLESLILLD